MTAILSKDGLIEIPEAFRKADDLKPGQHCDIERVGHGEYRLTVAADTLPKERLIDVLLRCPVKGFFRPLDRTETTDDLKPLTFE